MLENAVKIRSVYVLEGRGRDFLTCFVKLSYTFHLKNIRLIYFFNLFLLLFFVV